jgi:ABC-type glycerol-3-phosphate transport system substrate-binding protein
MFWRKGTRKRVVVLVAGLLVLAGCGGGSSSDAAAGAGKYCDKVKALGDFTDKLSQVDVVDRSGTAKKLADLSNDIGEIVNVAPAEIKPQWTVVGEIFTKLSSTMEASKDVDVSDPSQIDPKIMAALNELRTAPDELDKQGEAIDIYTKEACGFAIGS